MLLCLDIAGTVGWAAGRKGDPCPRMGAIGLPASGSYGARLGAWENALIDLLEVIQPTEIVIEAPLPVFAQLHESTARWLLGLAAYAHGEAWRYGVPVREASADTARTAMMGQCRLSREDKAGGRSMKDLVAAWCASRGWTPPDHNAADAALLWAYTMSR